MPLTTIPLAINTLIGVAIWTSSISTILKIVITVLLVVKYAIYFHTALMADSDFNRISGLVIVGLMNIAGIVCTAIFGIWTALISFTTLLIILIVWRVITVIELTKKGGSKE